MGHARIPSCGLLDSKSGRSYRIRPMDGIASIGRIVVSIDEIPPCSTKMWRKCSTEVKRFGLLTKLSAKAKKSLLPRTDAEVAALARDMDEVARINVSLLRGRRQDADITQEQIGYALGLSRDVVYKMEALKTPINIPQSIVWARLTGLEPHEYFEELTWQLRKLYPPRKR